MYGSRCWWSNEQLGMHLQLCVAGLSQHPDAMWGFGRAFQIHGTDDVVGISVSTDGVHFGLAQYIKLNATESGCGSPARTPQVAHSTVLCLLLSE